MNKDHDSMVTVPYRIIGVRIETADTFTVEMEPQEGGPRFSFEPGQFNMLYVFGKGEAPISISGDPARTIVRNEERSYFFKSGC